MSSSVFRYALMPADRPKSPNFNGAHNTHNFNDLSASCIERGHIGSSLALKTAAWLFDSFV